MEIKCRKSRAENHSSIFFLFFFITRQGSSHYGKFNKKKCFFLLKPSLRQVRLILAGLSWGIQTMPLTGPAYYALRIFNFNVNFHYYTSWSRTTDQIEWLLLNSFFYFFSVKFRFFLVRFITQWLNTFVKLFISSV